MHHNYHLKVELTVRNKLSDSTLHKMFQAFKVQFATSYGYFKAGAMSNLTRVKDYRMFLFIL